MINLLPPAEKQKLRSERRARLIMILGFVIMSSLLCMTLILLSIKFYVSIEADYQKTLLVQEKESQAADFADMNAAIQRYNRILSQLDSFYGREIYFNQVLKIITGVSGAEGLHLTSFYIARTDGGSIQATISGVSDTRENLLVFRKNLESNPEIKNPAFSQESWLNPKDANFSLTFQVKKNEAQQ